MSAPIVEVFLPAGRFHFGGGNVRVGTLLGTCIAIAVWHPVRRLGGMCHFLLPARRPNAALDATLPGLYAADVMDLFAGALLASGTSAHEYVVKVAGGGNMFPNHLMPVECRAGRCTDSRRAACPSIGCVNIIRARELLTAADFRIAAEDVGGEGSRQILFELWSGELWIKRGAALTGGSQVAA